MNAMKYVMFCVLLVMGGPVISADGHLILIGGGKKPASVMEKFLALSGGKDALIVIIPTASGDRTTGTFYQDLFTKDYGCTNVVWLDLWTRPLASNPDYVALIDKAGGVFFSGGDQRRINGIIVGTPVAEAVARAYEGGAVIGGTSAGTACQSPLMLSGDGNFEVIQQRNVELWKGLGLFKGVIIDQHFVARQRQNRLLNVVLEHPHLLGIGVDEATAVWVKPGGEMEVLGESLVQVYDARNASIRRGSGESSHLGGHGLRLHLLLPGDRFDLAKGTVLTAP